MSDSETVEDKKIEIGKPKWKVTIKQLWGYIVFLVSVTITATVFVINILNDIHEFNDRMGATNDRIDAVQNDIKEMKSQLIDLRVDVATIKGEMQKFTPDK